MLHHHLKRIAAEERHIQRVPHVVSTELDGIERVGGGDAAGLLQEGRDQEREIRTGEDIARARRGDREVQRVRARFESPEADFTPRAVFDGKVSRRRR